MVGGKALAKHVVSSCPRRHGSPREEGREACYVQWEKHRLRHRVLALVGQENEDIEMDETRVMDGVKVMEGT